MSDKLLVNGLSASRKRQKQGSVEFVRSGSSGSSSSKAKRRKKVLTSSDPGGSPAAFYPSNIHFDSSLSSSSRLIPTLMIPPMVNSDARERYPFLVAHVYNSMSYDLVWKLLSTYYRSDMIIAQELTGDFPEILKSRIEIHGRTTCAHYWYERMSSSPDVLFTVKGFELNIDEESNTGVLSVHFSLSGTRFVQLEDPQILAPVIIDHDAENNKTVYKLGDIVCQSGVQTLSPSSKKDFDAIMHNSNSSDHDFGIMPSSSSSLSSLHQQNWQQMEKVCSKFEEPETIFPFRNVNGDIQQTASPQMQKLPPDVISIAALVGDTDEFSALKPTSQSLLSATPILETNKPKQGQNISFSPYCYDGFVKMRFDSDSLVYFNEFRMHNAGVKVSK